MVALNPIKMQNRRFKNRKTSEVEFARTYDRENNDSREHGSEAIRQTDHDGVAVAIIVYRIVRRERYQTTES